MYSMYITYMFFLEAIHFIILMKHFETYTTDNHWSFTIKPGVIWVNGDFLAIIVEHGI